MNFTKYTLLGLSMVVAMLVGTTSYSFADDEYISPRNQMESGVAPEDVQCKENHVLVIRTNGLSACVKQSTAERQGWELYQNDKTNLDVALTPSQLAMEINSKSIAGDHRRPSTDSVSLEVSGLPELGKTVTVTVTVTNPYDYDMTLDNKQTMGLVITGNNIELVGKEAELFETTTTNYVFEGLTTKSYFYEPFLAKGHQTQVLEAQIKITDAGRIGFDGLGVNKEIIQTAFYVDKDKTITYEQYYQENKKSIDKKFSEHYKKQEENRLKLESKQKESLTNPVVVISDDYTEPTIITIPPGTDADTIMRLVEANESNSITVMLPPDADDDTVARLVGGVPGKAIAIMGITPAGNDTVTAHVAKYDELLVSELEGEIKELLQRVEENDSLAQSHESEIAKLTKELDAVTDDEETREDLEEKISGKVQDLEETKSAIIRDKSKITEFETRIDELKKNKN